MNKSFGFLLTVCMLFGTVPASWAAPFVIDSFEPGSQLNTLGGEGSTYQREPSQIQAVRGATPGFSGYGCLVLTYTKKGKGGPYDSGGWIGYYELLEPANTKRWFDASKFRSITFWVCGQKGKENFKVGLTDAARFVRGDAVKSRPVSEYVPQRVITTGWQKATIPMNDLFVVQNQLASIVFCIEGDFPNGESAGRIYIDELTFE